MKIYYMIIALNTEALQQLRHSVNQYYSCSTQINVLFQYSVIMDSCIRRYPK